MTRKEYLRLWRAKRRNDRLAAGLCAKCDTPRTAHAYYCERHAKYMRDATRKYSRKKRCNSPARICRLERLRQARLNQST